MTKKNHRGTVSTVIARGVITYPNTHDGADRYVLKDTATGTLSEGIWLCASLAKQAWKLSLPRHSMSRPTSTPGLNEIEIVTYPIRPTVNRPSAYGVNYAVRYSTRASDCCDARVVSEVKKEKVEEKVFYTGPITEYRWVRSLDGVKKAMTVVAPGAMYIHSVLEIEFSYESVVVDAWAQGQRVEIYGVLGSDSSRYRVRVLPEVKVEKRGIPCGYHVQRAVKDKPYLSVDMLDPSCVYRPYGPVSLDDMSFVKRIVDADEKTEIEIYVDPVSKIYRLRLAK